jgi:hypothetical protein
MENVPMIRPEEALAVYETRYFHDSTFARLDGGKVLPLTWFYGGKEPAKP